MVMNHHYMRKITCHSFQAVADELFGSVYGNELSLYDKNNFNIEVVCFSFIDFSP